MHYEKDKLVRLIALQYAARKCKQNKRYHTSARLTLAYIRKAKFFYFGCALVRRFYCKQARDGQTYRQTDRRTDRVRRNMRPPPREEGRIKMVDFELTKFQ